MSFPRYERYKNAGIGWLSEVPAHWQVIPNKAILRGTNDLVGTNSSDFTLLSLTLFGVIVRDIESGKGKFPAEFDSYKAVEAKDLVFCLFDLDETPRTIGLANQAGMITGAYEVLRCKPLALPSYVCYFYLHVDEFKGLRPWYTGLRKVVRPDTFMSIKLALPPLDEQEAIVFLLDSETAKVDRLIEEQRRLIELLKEKRQAVISHAVTKGLDKTTALIDSAVDWIGRVPSTWQVKKATLIGRLFGSEAIPEEMIRDDGDVAFIKVSSLSASDLEISSWKWFLDREFVSGYRPRTNFIVFPKRGEAIFGNKVNVVTRPSVIDPNLMGWKLYIGYDARFFAYALKARKLDELADISTVPQINNKHIGPERFPVPPLPEQVAIRIFIDAEVKNIDGLIKQALQAIALLEERRSALISAAVTGKIDVRKYTPKEAA